MLMTFSQLKGRVLKRREIRSQGQKMRGDKEHIKWEEDGKQFEIRGHKENRIMEMT